LVYFIQYLRKKSWGLVIQDFGYRRKEAEIIEVAQRYNLKLEVIKKYDHLTEFKRSHILGPLIEKNKIIKSIFSFIGCQIPYIRVFKFTKLA